MLPYLLAIGITFVVFGAFLLLTALEGARGARLFGSARDRFDARVARAFFILEHVNWGAFLSDVVRAGFERALHDTAHGSLLLVRFIERVLTRTVRALRMRREVKQPGQSLATQKPPLLLSASSYLKSALQRTRRTPKTRSQITEEFNEDSVATDDS
jgi:hypothetical protein